MRLSNLLPALAAWVLAGSLAGPAMGANVLVTRTVGATTTTLFSDGFETYSASSAGVTLPNNSAAPTGTWVLGAGAGSSFAITTNAAPGPSEGAKYLRVIRGAASTANALAKFSGATSASFYTTGTLHAEFSLNAPMPQSTVAAVAASGVTGQLIANFGFAGGITGDGISDGFNRAYFGIWSTGAVGSEVYSVYQLNGTTWSDTGINWVPNTWQHFGLDLNLATQQLVLTSDNQTFTGTGTAGGVSSFLFRGGSTNARFYLDGGAFPVPEPSAAAMGLLGMGLIAPLCRSRRLRM